MAERVLIVAADAALRAAVVRALAPAGYAVELAEGARRAREVLAANDIALTILAPEGIGSVAGDLAGELRGAARLLVIDKPARALDRRAGPMIACDVSLATRFDEEELLAQTRALLATEDVVAPAEELLHFDAFTLDPSGYSVRDADGREISLTGAEFALLLAFARRPGRVLTRDQLLDLAWSRRAEAYDRTVDVLIGRLRRKLEADPKKPRLIVTVRGIGYKFLAKPTSATHRLTTIHGADEEGAMVRPSLALPNRPSIAVLPFQNMSGDPDQEYFTDGIVEEIITALSRMHWLFVIARNSSFAYKGRTIDVKQVGRELGVRYVLEGSVRKAANRLRISGQLIDATTGGHLWADRFERALEDVFEMQDHVTSSVIGAIGPRLERAEIERAKRKPTESLDAYDYYLRGMGGVYRWSKDSVSEALQHFHKGIEIDPEFASAYSAAAWCYFWRMFSGCMVDRAQEVAETTRLAAKAAECGNDDAVALSLGGLALGYVGDDAEAGLAMVDRALVLNPNLAAAWNASATLRTFLGDSDTVVEHAAHAMRLSPPDPRSFLMHAATAATALAHFSAGRYDEAWRLAERAYRERPNFLPAMRVAAAGNAFAGRLNEARGFITRALQLDPELRISNLKDRVPAWRSELFDKYIAALRMAGLPE